MVKQEVRPRQSPVPKRVSIRGLHLLSCLAAQAREFLPAIRAEFESAVDSEMAKLDALVDTEQIRVAVKDAAKCYYTEHWPALCMSTFKSRRLLRTVVGFFVLLALAILFLKILPHPPSVISVTFPVVLLTFLLLPLIFTIEVLQRLNSLV